MKFIRIFFIFALVAGVCFAQEKTGGENGWTRVETDNKEISFALPADFLVNAEPQDFGQRFHLIGFQNGATIEVKIYKDGNARQRLKYPGAISNDALEESSFKAGKFSGRNVISGSGKRYYNSLSLASDDYFYKLSISAARQQSPEVVRFLHSIRLHGKALIVRKTNEPEAEDSVVLLSSLTTSAKVAEALSRKDSTGKTKISYELESTRAESELLTDEIAAGKKIEADARRPSVILKRAFPAFSPGAFSPGNRQSARARLRVTLLADGRIGDIVVYSNADRSFIVSLIDAIKKTKFIPAELNGKPVDSQEMFEYSFQVSSDFLRI